MLESRADTYRYQEMADRKGRAIELEVHTKPVEQFLPPPTGVLINNHEQQNDQTIHNLAQKTPTNINLEIIINS